MKSQKASGKGPSRKPSGGKPRWEGSDSKRPSSSSAAAMADDEHKPASDSKPSANPNPATAMPKSSAAAGPSAAQLPGPVPLLLPPAAAPALRLPQDAPPPPPAYGFHNLERRTIVIADGSVRSYFALPPDLPVDRAVDRFLPHGGPRGISMPDPGIGLGLERHLDPGPHGPRFSPDDFRDAPPYGLVGASQHDYWSSLGLDRPRGAQEGSSLLKRKFGEEEDLARHRHHIMQYGNPAANPGGFPSGLGDREYYLDRSGSPRRDHPDDPRDSKQPRLGEEAYDVFFKKRERVEVDAPPVVIDVNLEALSRAFFRFLRTINENTSQKKNFLENGKNGPLSCIACGRTSKEFPDVHSLVVHAYGSQNKDSRADHLGLHKALCVLMGWSFEKVPDSSKAYQLLSSDTASAHRDDLILWPPTVIIQNTLLGQRRDGRMEGMGNKEMDNRIKELGFGGGKSRSLYGKEGHLGITVVKFAGNRRGLEEAEHLAEFFEKENCGRKGWLLVQASQSDENNPSLVKVDEKTGEKKRILYGYLATVFDIDAVDAEVRKKSIIKSKSDPGV